DMRRRHKRRSDEAVMTLLHPTAPPAEPASKDRAQHPSTAPAKNAPHILPARPPRPAEPTAPARPAQPVAPRTSAPSRPASPPAQVGAPDQAAKLRDLVRQHEAALRPVGLSIPSVIPGQAPRAPGRQ